MFVGATSSLPGRATAGCWTRCNVFFDMNAELEKTVGQITLVFGHNDLLAANFIDDGKRLWLLDWDYAGYNAALFDLANLSSNNELTPEQEDWLPGNLLSAAGVTDRLRRRLAAMKCVSLLRENLMEYRLRDPFNPRLRLCGLHQ